MNHRRSDAVLLVAVLLVAVVTGAVVACEPARSPVSSQTPAPPPRTNPAPLARAGAPGGTPPAGGATAAPAGNRRAALGQPDGVVPPGTTVFDAEVPAVAALDPALRSALRAAATDAASADVTFVVNSGWRSRAYQEQLRRAAVARYGSAAAAARWVADAATSAHVSGDAVDLGPAARAWLSERGAAYGLCRVYDNEPWHFELRPDAPTTGCPARYPDAAADPSQEKR